jgi:hypothetical protein
MKGIDAHYDLSNDHSSRHSPSSDSSADDDNAQVSKINAFFAYQRRIRRSAKREAKVVAKNDSQEVAKRDAQPDFFREYLGALTMKKICSLDTKY